MTLQRLVIEMKPGELVIRVLYRSQNGPNPGTKARRREVRELAREGLARALEGLEDGAECVGNSGFTTREDVLLAMSSPNAHKLVKKA
jgi:DNA-binding IclR family transcriptional regulator